MAPEPIELGSSEKRGLRELNHLRQSNKAQIVSSQTGIQEQTQVRWREPFNHKNGSLLQAVRDQPVIRGAAELVEEAPSDANPYRAGKHGRELPPCFRLAAHGRSSQAAI